MVVCLLRQSIHVEQACGEGDIVVTTPYGYMGIRASFHPSRVRIHQPFFRTFFVLFSRFFYIQIHLNETQLLIG